MRILTSFVISSKIKYKIIFYNLMKRTTTIIIKNSVINVYKLLFIQLQGIYSNVHTVVIKNITARSKKSIASFV